MKWSGRYHPKFEFDSLYHAIDHLVPPGDKAAAKDYKRAILDVSHVVELLLKERLHREHAVLIWRDVEKYPSLDAQTVSVDEAIARLGSICGLKISESDRATINARDKTGSGLRFCDS